AGDPRGSSVTTHYYAIQVRPVRWHWFDWEANIADMTFATSEGGLCHTGADPCPSDAQVTSMPLGVAMDCVAPGSATGTANIDLSGTPFVLDDDNAFLGQGFLPGGSTTYSSDDQVVDLTGGGFCGWNAPAVLANPFNDSPKNDANGGWDIRLSLDF